MRPILNVRTAALLATGSFLLLLWSGCSSSRPSQPTTGQSTAPTGPMLSLLYTTTDGTLMLHDARRDTSRRLADGVTVKDARSVSPTGRYLAFSYATADSSRLGLFNLRTQHLARVHAVEGTAVYSLAWHPDQDRLAFGHYRPTDGGERGPGGIRIVTPGGSSRDVGCEAVRELLDWLPDGRLAARTDERLYLVSPDDCATRASRDVRRMHHISYSPNGERVAYIHRELKYDRSAHEYVPDSSLVISDVGDGNSETLFGNERRARHLRWGPDGSELAFDVKPEEGRHRQIVIYDGNRTVFLVPPEETTADQVYPRWSPSGNHLAFTLRTSDGSRAAVRVKGQTRRLGPTTGPVEGWLDDRSVVVSGPDSLRVQGLSGTTRLVYPAPATLLHVWRQPAL